MTERGPASSAKYEYVCIMKELPYDFIQRIRDQFGNHSDSLIKALDGDAATTIHMHPRRQRSEMSKEENLVWFEGGLILQERPSFTLDPFFHAGAYYPQESSSMILHWLLTQVFGSMRDLTCLDLCAAPGGKSLLLSEFIGKSGFLISNELIKSRNSILREVLGKWSAENTIVTQNEPSSFSNIVGFFDVLLVDAPCSGEGMFRKDETARVEWSVDNVRHCALRQRQILTEAMPALKNNGILIYSTCTFSPQENEDNCKWILSKGNFETVRFQIPDEWGVHIIDDQSIFGMQFLPGDVPGEGFFVSVFRKIENAGNLRIGHKNVFSPLSKKESEVVTKWYSGNGFLVKNSLDEIYASPVSIEYLNRLASALYITMLGLEIGKVMRDDLIPAHSLALLNLTGGQNIELDYDQSIKYLKGEQFQVQGPIGWCVVTYCGMPLGWIKNLGNRFNNYYPKESRIRMK